MQRLKAVVSQDPWQRAAAHQGPSQVWRHSNGISDYQVWTCYRIATKQLNIYHADRHADNSCRALAECHGCKETSAHIFWECPKARACWGVHIGHWTGERDERPLRASRFLGSGNRQAPVLPARQRIRIHNQLLDDLDAGVAAWNRIWFLMSSICLSHLWSERNDAVFRGVQSTASHSAARFWELGLHLTALAKREHRGPDTAVVGALLHTCLDLFALEPRDGSVSSGDSYDALPYPKLVSWLRMYQTSCT